MTARLCAPDEPSDDSLMVVASGRRPRETEVEANGSVVQLRAIPLVVGGSRTGALILVRDVTELRRRERELMSKDATIKEIHHRVKNNLQTVAALLRLQARRLSEPEARSALEEAVRRVGSIAVVHETLSLTPDEVVDFDDVAARMATMAVEVSAPEARLTPRLVGTFGRLPAVVATPLAMVLTELLQNALKHGFGPPRPVRPPASPTGRSLVVTARRLPGRLTVMVADSGAGLPEGFDPGWSDSLGLQIVRTLVVAELGGSLKINGRPAGGTLVVVDCPSRPPHRCFSRPGADPGRQPGARALRRGPWPYPGAAALERPPLVLADPAPDAGVLAALYRPLQAGLDDRAARRPASPRLSGAARDRCSLSGRTAQDPRLDRRRHGASPCGPLLLVAGSVGPPPRSDFVEEFTNYSVPRGRGSDQATRASKFWLDALPVRGPERPPLPESPLAPRIPPLRMRGIVHFPLTMHRSHPFKPSDQAQDQRSRFGPEFGVRCVT